MNYTLSLSQFLSTLGKTSLGRWFQSTPLSSALGWLYVAFLLPHCFAAFVTLKPEKYLAVYASVGYLMQLYMVLGAVAVKAFSAVIAAAVKKEKKRE